MSLKKRGASLLVGAGAITALVATSGTAHAADPVEPGGIDPSLTTVNLLNINDFHGRIDTDGTGASGKAFACTVVETRAQLGEDSTALLSAGDNIGASPFTSASQEDLPTIQFLNTLGLEASAVGNHEFDRGFSDLTGRVSQAADFDLLGANVYERGTTTPALDEYSIVEVGGLKVGVVGAVTQQTPSLVSPQGVSGLDFGDPVEAVNRVAAQLKDGDATNGEADIVVAEYHEGATEGDDLTTLDAQVAAGGAFADIVNDTAGEVDAIFTGHTHKGYAWDAPAPDGGTRPIIQSNSYGDTLGQLQLGFDEETGEVTQYSATNVEVADPTDTCASNPTYASASAIVDEAVASAGELGKKVIGTVSDDITTAHNDGARDNRQRESTLGNLTADIWLDALNQPGRGGADIGIMNPGGLRDELLYEPTGDEEPGEVTYAEAASINPFANTLMTVDLTGAQVVTLLEQQWQPEGSSRPFLKLGLSDNVTYTYDPDAAAGSRISSVSIDGEPLDESATYTIASGSFLIGGGDNFTVLAEGSNAKDTGLIDTDAFVNYFGARDEVSPDHRKQAVAITDQPSELTAGDEVSFTASGFDLTSLGSPTNSEVEVFVGDDSVGTFPITAGLIQGVPTRNGTADISFTVPEQATAPAGIAAADDGTASQVRLVASPSDTEVSFPVTITADEPTSTTTDPTTSTSDPTTSTSSDPSTSTSTSTSTSGTGTSTGTPTATSTSGTAPSTDDDVTGPVVETDDTTPGPGAGVVGSGLGLLLAAGAALAIAGARRTAGRRH
ncbi:bifunctional metallophosphatase/5'-nucleotidase [Janibacter indicus]|uniref:Bifunctional metallophosphatase/5'-nucleotidase n=1 Tax=Janibacter indicus TaxID=857417 RepID=A0A7L9J249_9MICO|nr:bifunctional UDP-sugar hydrolase/5'-nucleotidase [Janibacter indicus]QOK23083.1 bifunctional metallophosphatase/5'-nucleotidase [Janibacter indicus]